MRRGGDSVHAAEFKSAREYLRQTPTMMARLIGVSEGTIKNWEKAKYAIPAGAADDITELTDYTKECVEEACRLVDQGRTLFLVHRLPEEIRTGPVVAFGLAWWRLIAYQVQQRYPHVRIGYVSELDRLTGSRDATLTKSITIRHLPPPPDIIA